jgi:DUF4097 and DUF4098 domain-containing protein YvlB
MIRTRRRKSHVLIPAALLLVSACTATTLAAPRDGGIHKRVEREAEVRGRTVSISTAVSNLTVGAGTDDRLRVTAKLDFWSSVDEWNERAETEFDVQLKELADRIDISIEMPDFDSSGRRRVKTEYDVKLSITLPRSTLLEIENRYGDVTVEVNGVGGRLEVKTSSGGVEVSDVKGDAKITNSYADVTAERIGGRLDVATKSGGIVAREVGREAELSSSYGSVEASRIGGNLRVVSSSGPSKISDVEGSLELTGSYADAIVERIAGPAEISIKNGGVTADDIKGNLTISCSYGTVRASRVEGALSVNSSGTGVQAKQIAGAVDVETTYAGVAVVGAGGAVTVRNENGAIRVKGLFGEALTATHNLETTYADVDFRWPEGSGLAYRLESSYGHLECDFPGTLEDRGSRLTLDGSTGDSAASVSLKSKSGSVRLRGE